MGALEEMHTMLEKFSDVVKQTDVNRVFGEPTEAEGRILIPLADVRYGLGSSLGFVERGNIKEDPELSETASGTVSEDAGPSRTSVGAAGASGAVAHPLGYIEVGPDGSRIVPVVDRQKVTLAALLFAAWSVLWIVLAIRASAEGK